MLKNLSIRTGLLSLFAVMAFLLLVVSSLGLYALQHSTSSLERMNQLQSGQIARLNEGYISLLRAHSEAGQAVRQMEIGLLDEALTTVRKIDMGIMRARQEITEAEKMRDISASSDNIADILGVIDSIAFQTHILALNASVEAARAREQGRGFAVVANDVRTLASRSAEAAKEIRALIANSRTHVTEGYKLANQAGETMDEIAQKNHAGNFPYFS